MTNAPSDLLAHRSVMAGITGLTNPADIGIVGDGAHQRTGGYHEGKDVLVSIGRYHPPASSHVGAAGEDYSARLARDRNGLTLSASAVDYGDNWPHGGREAWLRFNNALVAALHANVPALAAVRAVNYSPDGIQRLRTDRQSGWSVITSTDQVTIHTHAEYYRDTEGHRQATLDYVANLARAAVNPTPVRPPTATPQGKAPVVYLATDRKDGSPTFGAVFLVTDDHKSHWFHKAGDVSEIVNRWQCGALALGTDNGKHSDWWMSWTNTAGQEVKGVVLTGWSAAVDGPIVDPDNPDTVLTPEQVAELAKTLAEDPAFAAAVAAGVHFPDYTPKPAA